MAYPDSDNEGMLSSEKSRCIGTTRYCTVFSAVLDGYVGLSRGSLKGLLTMPDSDNEGGRVSFVMTTMRFENILNPKSPWNFLSIIPDLDIERALSSRYR